MKKYAENIYPLVNFLPIAAALVVNEHPNPFFYSVNALGSVSAIIANKISVENIEELPDCKKILIKTGCLLGSVLAGLGSVYSSLPLYSNTIPNLSTVFTMFAVGFSAGRIAYRSALHQAANLVVGDRASKASRAL